MKCTDWSRGPSNTGTVELGSSGQEYSSWEECQGDRDSPDGFPQPDFNNPLLL